MTENLNAMDLLMTMTTSQVRRIYEESFVSQNMLTMVTTIKVLAKRGCYDDIANVFTGYIRSGQSLVLESGFATALGQSFFDIRNSSPIMGQVGKSISKRSSSGEALYDSNTLEEDLSKLSNNFPEIKLPKNLLNLITIKDGMSTEDDYRQYLEGMTIRDISNMKVDTYNAIINGLIKIYMPENDRITATQKAISFVKETLHPQLAELSKNRNMVLGMKEYIYQELMK